MTWHQRQKSPTWSTNEERATVTTAMTYERKMALAIIAKSAKSRSGMAFSSSGRGGLKLERPGPVIDGFPVLERDDSVLLADNGFQ